MLSIKGARRIKRERKPSVFIFKLALHHPHTHPVKYPRKAGWQAEQLSQQHNFPLLTTSLAKSRRLLPHIPSLSGSIENAHFRSIHYLPYSPRLRQKSNGSANTKKSVTFSTDPIFHYSLHFISCKIRSWQDRSFNPMALFEADYHQHPMATASLISMTRTSPFRPHLRPRLHPISLPPPATSPPQNKPTREKQRNHSPHPNHPH